MQVMKETSYNKKEDHLILQVNVILLMGVDTLAMQSVYFFITNTNKVSSDNMIQMYLRSLII